MKHKSLAILVIAGSWACSAASGAGEKYIKIDPEGKPKYISEGDAHNFAGMADDKDLCSIAFRLIKIDKAPEGEGSGEGEGEGGAKKHEEVDGFSFDCAPSEECDAKNKEAVAAKKKLIAAIAAQKAIINPPEKSKAEKKKEEEAEKTKSKETREKDKKEKKAKKEAAEKKKGELEGKLAKFKPECSLKYYTAEGGDGSTEKTQLTADQIKTKKIQYIVCLCQKIEIPPE